MIYTTCDVPMQHASGGATAEVVFYQQTASGSLIIEMPTSAGGVESMLHPSIRHFTVKAFQPAHTEQVWQPRTERGRRLMELRKHVVASGVRLLDLDEINQELAGGRRQSV